MTTNMTIEQKAKLFDKLILAFENYDLDVLKSDTWFLPDAVVDVEELVELLEKYTGE